MPKASMGDEIQILRFFEEGPIDKAEVVFKIVSEKMRERLAHEGRIPTRGSAKGPGSRRKRHQAADESVSPSDPQRHSGATTDTPG